MSLLNVLLAWLKCSFNESAKHSDSRTGPSTLFDFGCIPLKKPLDPVSLGYRQKNMMGFADRQVDALDFWPKIFLILVPNWLFDFVTYFFPKSNPDLFHVSYLYILLTKHIPKYWQSKFFSILNYLPTYNLLLLFVPLEISIIDIYLI